MNRRQHTKTPDKAMTKWQYQLFLSLEGAEYFPRLFGKPIGKCNRWRRVTRLLKKERVLK